MTGSRPAADDYQLQSAAMSAKRTFGSAVALYFS
jgi:hypothetical protein